MSKSRSVLSFDYGTKSIGVAIGQELTGTASPLSALKAKDGIPNWDEIEKILKEWQPDLIVVGLPLDLAGKELETIAPRAKKFANRIHGRFGYAVELHDERLSTVEAKAELFERGGYRSLSKGNIDSQSAVVILESWFERQYGA
ncbi:Holliday junction resolvase RuvX [Photobacterium iliopiscarium]|jgi:putative Holliday junction resolvase|uniref:Putative pre-16S rRNA nuclease n=1 Tax=Photobacterium iliopiscarium TaxID=56192 RepID=A0A2T3MIX4_9GAMM|nr:Holliday junction resolvase RuvX [Photobacterium iliopiscarium]KJG12047.1 Holliday junction resolvase [Photobacterium iliopiscarium]MCD9467437.1 Holliday junction resolvase RuvX [Photobacterium iliopiscarium]MCD9489043.1 Holliday junction resolvase RuvX [Photobacterium iliopiscarium]MCF2245717.1 Holliday junction resolvase RuvX [Photobacterium iliopiscarium]PST90018.1 Holliday junction resolvase RuvX [Photobacterium iliopiscarium]